MERKYTGERTYRNPTEQTVIQSGGRDIRENHREKVLANVVDNINQQMEQLRAARRAGKVTPTEFRKRWKTLRWQSRTNAWNLLRR